LAITKHQPLQNLSEDILSEVSASQFMARLYVPMRSMKGLSVTLSKLRRLFFVFLLLGACTAVKPVFAAPSAVIQNDTGYVDISGFYHVVGEVKNTGDVWLQFIQVSASLKDQNGVVVDIKPATPWLIRLPPNTAAGFDAIELNTTLALKIRSYTLKAVTAKGPLLYSAICVPGPGNAPVLDSQYLLGEHADEHVHRVLVR
jgi:hypothetical protein